MSAVFSVLLTVVAACSASTNDQNIAAPLPEISGKMGACSGGFDQDIHCELVASGDKAVQIAHIPATNPRAGARPLLFLAGGPGADPTLSAQFTASAINPKGDRDLLVLGEPGSLFGVGKECEAEVQLFADWLLSEGVLAYPESDGLVDSCEQEVGKYSWDAGLFGAIATHLDQNFGPVDVLAFSFGGRIYEALAEQGMSAVQAVLVAPAPSGRSEMIDVVESRGSHTNRIVCETSIGCGAFFDLDDVAESESAAALLNLAYSWYSNAPVMADIELAALPTQFQHAAKAFAFVDPSGSVDPQLLSFLVAECQAWRTGKRVRDIDDPFTRFLWRMHSPCQSLVAKTETMPVGEHPLDEACVIYSANDPVSNSWAASTYGDAAFLVDQTPSHDPIELNLIRLKEKSLCDS